MRAGRREIDVVAAIGQRRRWIRCRPEATQTVMPMAAASWNAASKAVIDCCVQDDSALPQLMEITEGLFVVSWIAVVIASRNAASVLAAK